MTGPHFSISVDAHSALTGGVEGVRGSSITYAVYIYSTYVQYVHPMLTINDHRDPPHEVDARGQGMALMSVVCFGCSYVEMDFEPWYP